MLFGETTLSSAPDGILVKQDDANRAAKPQRRATVAPRDVRTVRSADLFLEDKEIVIEHAGDNYRLRITRSGKLILYK
jgi:hemin uptake protein HemP